MAISVVNIEKKFELIEELHAYKVIAQMNNYYFNNISVILDKLSLRDRTQLAIFFIRNLKD